MMVIDEGTATVAGHGIGSISDLLLGVMQMRAAKEKQEREEREAAKNRMQTAQRDQLAIAQRMGENEQGALQQLLGVLARSQR